MFITKDYLIYLSINTRDCFHIKEYKHKGHSRKEAFFLISFSLLFLKNSIFIG